MSQEKTYKKCKHFDSKRCPHKKDKVMVMATQKFSEFPGGQFPTMSPPPNKDEVDKICGKCDAFTPHRQLYRG